jgi:DNA (cytosine-5)-methyltransferase 1
VSAYYNEIDPYAAQWLRNLISAGHIAPGDVDERSITDVRPADLAGYTQCHFFAGIGGWSYALRLAGWPDDRPVWTGSCPCQPFSAAGKGKGFADARHLWPDFFRLIFERRPAVVFGEQVASPLGREWLAGVRNDLERTGYAVGAADLCAPCVGAPHPRRRLYFAGMAHAGGVGSQAGLSGSHAREEGFADEPFDAGSLDAWRVHDLARGAEETCRRIGPGVQPLADGIPGRVGRLRAYGNAIVPQVAAAFVMACQP